MPAEMPPALLHQFCLPTELKGRSKMGTFVTSRSHRSGSLSHKKCDSLPQVKMERTVVIEDAGAGQCRYRITGAVKVRMFGIGHLVEKQVMSNSVDSLGLLAQVVDRCAAKPYTLNPTWPGQCAASSWAAPTAWACT